MRSSTIGLFVLAVLLGAAWGQQQPSQAPGTYYPVEAVNPNLPEADEAPNLATPQACVEHFVLSCERDDWLAAARALNFRLVEPVDAEKASRQARKLYYLLNQNLWIDWSVLPDRPDGVETGSLLSTGGPMTGQARRSIVLGAIALDGRGIPVRVERVKARGKEPVWLFAAQSVDNIDRLYEAKGPSWLAKRAPAWSRERILWGVPAWQWLAVLFLVVLALLVGWTAATLISRGFASRLPLRGGKLIQAIKWPTAIFTAALVSYIAVGQLLTLPGPLAAVGSPVLLAILVLSATWLPIRVLQFLGEHVIGEKALPHADTIDESGALAKLTVFRYVLALVILALGVSVLLISLDLFRALGITLLSSAGAMAVILGIAGHEVLGNLIAGMQIAITRPFRIGDTVIVEEYWGHVEEIRYTFVTVRTWDDKRIVFPIKYFLGHWFENWSATDRYLVKAIYLHLDYRADVESIRDKFRELVEGDEDWAGNRNVPETLVIDTGPQTITLRLACGGADPASAWRLSCRVREKLIAWLQQEEGGRYLPRKRVELRNRKADSGGQETDA
jgi:small-conductance mechanosensitive channel